VKRHGQRAGVAERASPAAAAWPAARLGDALVAIAERLFPQRRAPHLHDPPADIADSMALAGFVEDAACQVGLEVEPVDARVATVRGLLAEGGPVLVAHSGPGSGLTPSGIIASHSPPLLAQVSP